ncbi:UPF0711 protein C18orf21 homolog [Nematolebias whitei]|uniref:UPF0711 protein C18orf21 homolog n=1 Tax=Nematolebias whitei TaxID=451745 RepID=UPI0018971C94|nr:UPF0711 protein C18orf21 homolog [Nematolebias whitei]
MEPRSAKFFFEASLLYHDKCQELSRFFLQYSFKANALSKKKNSLSSLFQDTCYCSYCHQWLKPDNHRVRLWPKRRPSAQVQRILLRSKRGKRLSLAQKRLLLRFQKSSSFLMATCHACSKTTRHKGVNRDFLSTFAKTHCTPGSAGKHKTPQSSIKSNTTTPRPPGTNKTPTSTPRSSVSYNVSASSSTSSKSSTKTKTSVVQRLSKILLREDSQSSKKGGLKDFLCSL